MNKKLTAFFVGLYPLLTLLGIFLCPDGIHFLGYSSVMYAFFIALDAQSSVVSICSLVWILLFFLASIASYVELFLRKSCKIGFMLIAVDLLASIGYLLYLIITLDFYGLPFVLMGLLVRIGLFATLITAYRTPDPQPL